MDVDCTDNSKGSKRRVLERASDVVGTAGDFDRERSRCPSVSCVETDADEPDNLVHGKEDADSADPGATRRDEATGPLVARETISESSFHTDNLRDGSCTDLNPSCCVEPRASAVLKPGEGTSKELTPETGACKKSGGGDGTELA